MRITTPIAAACLLLTLAAALPARAQQAEASSDDSTVRIASRDTDLRRSSVSGHRHAEPAYSQPVYSGDPYGFLNILNHYRASVGLHPVAYDPNLSAWASQNNAVQCRRGIGHHVSPNCLQNCGWNYQSASEVAAGWLRSPGHRDNMLSPSITRVGIAYGPGPYWTLNAR